MTPQERQLIDDLFDRLAKLENTPRDPEAMSAIMQGLRGAPNAVYALVQTALVQDEALKRANDRIQQLESGHAGEQNQPGGFLDSMRDSIFGQSQPRGSGPKALYLTSARPAWAAARYGTAARWCSRRKDRQGPGQYGQPGYGQQPAYGQPPMVAATAARSAAEAAARSSERQRRQRPAWSADRCCSAASAR